MGEWKSSWGYLSHEFDAYPLTVEDQTQRAVLWNNLRGGKVRLLLSNRFTAHPLPVARMAVGILGGDGSRFQSVTLGGQESFAIPPGEAVWSDEVGLSVAPGDRLVVDIYVRQQAEIRSACSFYANDITSVRQYHGDCCGRGAEDREAFQPNCGLFAIEPLHNVLWGFEQAAVYTEDTVRTVAAFGDSITHQSRWTAPLAQRLYEAYPGRVALLNRGISGNRVLHDAPPWSERGRWFGEKALTRFERDVYGSGFTPDTVLFLEGTNDLIHPIIDRPHCRETVTPGQLIQGIETLARAAHSHGSTIFGGTLMPFRGLRDLWGEEVEAQRQAVNTWVRATDVFDGVLDFDAWERDPQDPARLNPLGGSADKLHPGEAGGRHMAEQVDLARLMEL